VTPSPSISWTDLFQAIENAGFTLKLRVVEKSGQPFLLLPSSPSLAARALSLYPAQTNPARLARLLLRTALRTGLPLPFHEVTIRLNQNDPFPRFLAEMAGVKSGVFPALAILAGNPNTAGRRFIVLLFDEHRLPVSVVKAGFGESATQLIRKETLFLQSAPSGLPGLPSFRASFASGQMEALALDFVEGDSPRTEDRQTIGKLLATWLDRGKQVGIGEIPAWQILEKIHASHPLFLRLTTKLAGRSFCPALVHGDFAPWNIKVSPRDGVWKVLDWERGERTGFPGWDWFHYVIQTGILVGRRNPETLVNELEDLFHTTSFQTYAELAGIQGGEKALAAAYLFHCVEVLKPAEGLDAARTLLSLLETRWLKD